MTLILYIIFKISKFLNIKNKLLYINKTGIKKYRKITQNKHYFQPNQILQ